MEAVKKRNKERSLYFGNQKGELKCEKKRGGGGGGGEEGVKNRGRKEMDRLREIN